jgi:hypothetical protein
LSFYRPGMLDLSRPGCWFTPLQMRHQIDHILARRVQHCNSSAFELCLVCSALAAACHITLHSQMWHQIDQILEELWRDERCTACPSALVLYAQCALPPGCCFKHVSNLCTLAAVLHPCRCATRLIRYWRSFGEISASLPPFRPCAMLSLFLPGC